MQGQATLKNQIKLNKYFKEISLEDLDLVQEFLFNFLYKINPMYKVTFMPNLDLQKEIKKAHLNQGRLNDSSLYTLDYGQHQQGKDINNILILKMRSAPGNEKLGRLAELIILAHEIGHAKMGNYNLDMQIMDGGSLKLVESATDAAIEQQLYKRFPLFGKIYRLCRSTHHYKTKEGDFKEFFKPLINYFDKEWFSYLRRQEVCFQKMI